MDEYLARLEHLRAAVDDALQCGVLPPVHRPRLMSMALHLAAMAEDAREQIRVLDQAVSASAREERTCHRGVYVDA